MDSSHETQTIEFIQKFSDLTNEYITHSKVLDLEDTSET